MEFSAQALATGKLFVIFVVLIVLLRLHAQLWLTIFAGALTTALLCGISPQDWPDLFISVLRQSDFLILCAMIFLILTLSGVQEATGQNHDLVEGLEKFIHSPRTRLIIFPAMVGLLPMPGGALFSCPMIRDASRNMALPGERKALINYWFRHIWELAWPLYPGYALACTLLGISLNQLWVFTFPMIFVVFATGWFFLLRNLDTTTKIPENADSTRQGAAPRQSLGHVLLNALPIAVTLLGAALLSLILGRYAPGVPGQVVFCISLALAVVTALFQGRGHIKRSLVSIAFGRTTGRTMLLLFAIYVFKDTIVRGGIVEAISHIGQSPLIVCLTFVFVPFISGLLTGILVGLVGLSFPILIGILDHSPMQEYTVPLVVLALVAGHCGQMLSPLHVCLVVTSEFFTTSVPGLLWSLWPPTLVAFTCGTIWALTLFCAGATF